MSESDLIAKLDQILAGQEAERLAARERERAIGALVQGLEGMLAILERQAEMLSLLNQAATGEPEDDSPLGHMLTNLVAGMTRVEDAIVALPAVMQEVVRREAGAERSAT